MQSLVQYWQDTMQIPEARWIVWGTVLLFALMIAIYVSFFFRGLAVGKSDEESTELMTDFRRMRDEGHLNDDEYSKLKEQIPEYQSSKSVAGTDILFTEQSQPEEKQFITLAEAQRRKQELGQQANDDNDEENEPA